MDAVQTKRLRVDIWSDVVCPWCYIGKRRYEAALAEFPHRAEVDTLWHSFELDPEAPRTREGDSGPAERLARKYGVSVARAKAMMDQVTRTAAEAGLAFDLEHARSGNTLDAHRLLHHAARAGKQEALKERLLRAYFTERLPVADPETLARLAGEVGLDAGEAREVLASQRFTAAVRADELSARELGIRGVPFFVVDRKYGVSGAQPSDVLLRVLERAWADAEAESAAEDAGAPGPSCDADGDDCA